jgi:hypothetical protein
MAFNILHLCPSLSLKAANGHDPGPVPSTSRTSCCCSWGWGENVSQNCGNQLAHCSFPRWYMNMESRSRMILTRKNRRTRRRTCPSTTLPTTNPVWTDVDANLGLRGERPATNRRNHGMATVPGYQYKSRNSSACNTHFNCSLTYFILLNYLTIVTARPIGFEHRPPKWLLTYGPLSFYKQLNMDEAAAATNHLFAMILF